MASCTLFDLPCREVWTMALQATPALAIIAAILTTRLQLKRQAYATQMTIARNHYRETLDLFLSNTDIIFLGTKADSYDKLTKDAELFKRYRWLFTITLFSLQELYFVYAKPENHNRYWARTVVIIASVFRLHFLSREFFPDFIRSGYDPDFLKYVEDGIRDSEHPAVKAGLSEFEDSVRATRKAA